MGHRGDRLTAREREALDRDGYLVVPALLDEPVLRPVRARLEDLVQQTIVAWDADPDAGVAAEWVVSVSLDRTDPPACDTVLATMVAAQTAGQALAFIDRGAGAAAVTNGTLELVLPGWQWRRRSWRPHPHCGCRDHGGPGAGPTPPEVAPRQGEASG